MMTDAGAAVAGTAQAASSLVATTAYAVLTGFVATYGYVKQYELQRDAITLSERQVDQAQDYLLLSTRTFDEITRPVYDRMVDYHNRYLNSYAQYETSFSAEAFADNEYTPDFDTAEGRAVVSVSANFDRARKAVANRRGRYASGASCSDDVQFAIAKATAQGDLAESAYRFEETKRMEYERWYWSRKVQVIDMVMRVAGYAQNGVIGGASTVSSGLAGVGDALGSLGRSVNSNVDAIAGSARSFGGLANGALRSLGFNNPRDDSQSATQGGMMNLSSNALKQMGHDAQRHMRSSSSGMRETGEVAEGGNPFISVGYSS